LKILFLADVFGVPGRRAVEEHLPALRERFEADLVIVNGENAADGAGITAKLADKLLAAGADVVTLGNHTYRRGGVASYLDESTRVIRPANFGAQAPGRGMAVVEARNGVAVAVVNLLGQLFLPTPVSPWEIVDALVEEARAAAPIVIVDFHAEATSEKIALATWLDGRHPHPRPDERRASPARGHRRAQRRRDDRAARLRDRRSVGARDRADANPSARPVRAGGGRGATGRRGRHLHRRGTGRSDRARPHPGLTCPQRPCPQCQKRRERAPLRA
jgi:YmdB-like protein